MVGYRLGGNLGMVSSNGSKLASEFGMSLLARAGWRTSKYSVDSVVFELCIYLAQFRMASAPERQQATRWGIVGVAAWRQ
jgi:hypothetical protein